MMNRSVYSILINRNIVGASSLLRAGLTNSRVGINPRFLSTTASVSASSPTRFIIQDFGVFDDYIPIPKSDRPSLLSPEGRKLWLKNTKHSVGNLFGVGMVKMSLKGWKPKNFGAEAEQLYTTMNEAYAKGDLEALQLLCTPSFFQKMKSEIKSRKGQFKWSLESLDYPPKVISVRVGRIADGLTLAQVMVQLQTSQSLQALSPKGKVVGQSSQQVSEYVVFQRMISLPDSHWQLYGKVTPKPLSQLLIKK